MAGSDTKEKVLNVAEELFAQQGYRATSLRAITSAAEVNLAAVNYHFGGKEALVEAVISRRLVTLNDQRAARLLAVRAEAEAAGRRVETGAVLLAFVEPTLLFPQSGAGARNFITLVGRAMADPDETARRIFMRLMQPVLQLFAELLAEAQPELPPEVLYWRLNFVIGALSHAMRGIDRCPLPLDIAAAKSAPDLVRLLTDFL
ncbi:MAG TPA: TetR/AcrR family transcriptional regulator, partial [Desulfurivibrionaceae bacterium]|nr:TetR/AcrR family transcriptional regulator [Desulfurivibrionaceae bacterium]